MSEMCHCWKLRGVPDNKKLMCGTLPDNKKLLSGTLPDNNLFLNLIKLCRWLIWCLKSLFSGGSLWLQVKCGKNLINCEICGVDTNIITFWHHWAEQLRKQKFKHFNNDFIWDILYIFVKADIEKYLPISKCPLVMVKSPLASSTTPWWTFLSHNCEKKFVNFEVDKIMIWFN